MKCPFCAESDNQVLESRVVDEGLSIRRRRECESCGKRFTTYEKIKENILWVIKKDGSRESFDREKIKRGILKAIEKRPISLESIDGIVNQVEREMLRKENEEVSSRDVGRAVLKHLKKIDKIAWLRFASVYLEFADVRDFEKAIEKV